MAIHPSAVVEEGAQIDPSATVGPFCVVGPEVTLGADVVLKSHVVISGQTTVGEGTVIFSFAVIGEIPQDLKFKGETTRLEIGARNRIREHVTMNCGTEGGGGRREYLGTSGELSMNLQPDYSFPCHVLQACVSRLPEPFRRSLRESGDASLSRSDSDAPRSAIVLPDRLAHTAADPPAGLPQSRRVQTVLADRTDWPRR